MFERVNPWTPSATDRSQNCDWFVFDCRLRVKKSKIIPDWLILWNVYILLRQSWEGFEYVVSQTADDIVSLIGPMNA